MCLLCLCDPVNTVLHNNRICLKYTKKKKNIFQYVCAFFFWHWESLIRAWVDGVRVLAWVSVRVCTTDGWWTGERGREERGERREGASSPALWADSTTRYSDSLRAQTLTTTLLSPCYAQHLIPDRWLWTRARGRDEERVTDGSALGGAQLLRAHIRACRAVPL